MDDHQEPVAFYKDAPERIYLQVCEDDHCEVPFKDHFDVTWSEDSINPLDVEYVRADIYTALIPTGGNAIRQMQRDEALLRQALEALDCIYSPLHVREINKVGEAIAALKERLA